MKKICIVTTRHISYNPRVLKEADTLYACGYEVCVVTINSHGLLHEFDRQLMKGRRWRLKTVDFRKQPVKERILWFYLSFRQKAASLLCRVSFQHGFAERAVDKAYDRLTRLAKDEKADLYIAHHPEALGIGYTAAKTNQARFGFDAEDFHTGMNESTSPGRDEAIIEYLEKKYLLHCDYVTAASKGIAEAYRDKYGISLPETITNAFPIEKLTVKAPHDIVRFYWYSQVVGPNRGLELLIEAAGKVRLPFEIHLRGSLQETAYQEQLLGLAENAGIRSRIYFHEPIMASEIIREGNDYDIGIALESDISVNRNICVTNKIFSYLMSGLAIIGTDTYGQKDIFTHFPEAVEVCRMNDAEDLARAMEVYLESPTKIMAAKQAAIRAAQQFFNWEEESRKLVTIISKTLSPGI